MTYPLIITLEQYDNYTTPDVLAIRSHTPSIGQHMPICQRYARNEYGTAYAEPLAKYVFVDRQHVVRIDRYRLLETSIGKMLATEDHNPSPADVKRGVRDYLNCRDGELTTYEVALTELNMVEVTTSAGVATFPYCQVPSPDQMEDGMASNADLIAFAKATLELMTSSDEWSSDTMDGIYTRAVKYGCANTSNDAGLFVGNTVECSEIAKTLLAQYGVDAKA